MSESGKAIFLSYASQDAEAARRVAEALRAAGVEVWFDQSELRGGDAWDQKIRQQVKACALFVPLISAATQARREAYFRLEWKLAEDRSHLMARGTPFILPVVIDGTAEPGALVPDSFLAVQWMRMTGDEVPAGFATRVQALLGDRLPGLVPGPVSVRSTPPQAPAGASEQSVAVLAFANLSSDKDNEYFSDGISEELINVLVRVPNLKVSARTSAFHFKGKSTPIPEIARQLGVAYVVEGSVRKAGDRVRITAQLIKAADGFHLWSETFTRDLKDIFAVQDEIAGLIAQNLSLKLNPPVAAAREVNPAAYRLFLEGRAIFNREVPAEYGRAIACFKESLALDPDAGQTWAGLSLVYGLSAGSGTISIKTGGDLARDAAQKAITLEPDLAQGYVALAFVELLYGWDWKKNAAVLQRASELAPGDAETFSLMAQLQSLLGRTERAIQLARKAVELDPLSYFANYALARSFSYAGQFEAMERQSERMIALNPSGLRSRLFLSVARLVQGRADEAAKAAEQVPPGWARRTALACARFAQGQSAESEAELNALKAADAAHAPYQIAEVHAFRGDIDLAFEWLETSYRSRDSGTALLKCDPLMRNLHDDPRWLPFLRKMGLADEQLA